MGNGSFFDKSDLWLAFIWILSVIATVYIYPYLPEAFAIHLSITGELGNEVSKDFGAWALLFLIPAGLLFMNTMKLVAAHSALDTLYDSEKPSEAKVDQANRMKTFMIVLKIFLFFIFLLLHVCFLFANLGWISPVHMNVLSMVSVGLLYVVIGVLMHRYNVPVNLPSWNGEQPDDVNRTAMRYTMVGFLAGGISFPFTPIFPEPFSLVWLLIMSGFFPIAGLFYGIRQGGQHWNYLKKQGGQQDTNDHLFDRSDRFLLPFLLLMAAGTAFVYPLLPDAVVIQFNPATSEARSYTNILAPGDRWD